MLTERKYQIGLLSDTHGYLDPAIFEYFTECDELWHAGDFGLNVLPRLKPFKPLRGVSGNIDGPEIRSEMPEELDWEIGGLRVYMIHAGGYPGNYARGVQKTLVRLKPDLFICGHSHILKVMRDPELKLLHMNPGACGHKGWHTMRTMLRFSIAEGKIANVSAIELGARGRVRGA